MVTLDFAGPDNRSEAPTVLEGRKTDPARAGVVLTAAWLLLFACVSVGVGIPAEEPGADGGVLALKALPGAPDQR
jgi:hypothetical protein